jgi:cytochrome c oxidase cbb3-type subunit 3
MSDDRDLLLDHNYDGIQELDHPLPRWWLGIFYITIVFGVFYASYYMLGSGPSEETELHADLKVIKANMPVAATAGGDEVFALILKDPEKLKLGAAVFAGKCVPCHGEKGQGVIGPNLTDDYWIHGTGKAREIAAVIAAGVPEKGMPSWGPMLTQEELNNVAAYVRSLRGTNPKNAKEPQGEKYDVSVANP